MTILSVIILILSAVSAKLLEVIKHFFAAKNNVWGSILAVSTLIRMSLILTDLFISLSPIIDLYLILAFSILTLQLFTKSPSWVDLLNFASDMVMFSASIRANFVLCVSWLSKQAVQKIGMKTTGIGGGVERGGRNALLGPGHRSSALSTNVHSFSVLSHSSGW